MRKSRFCKALSLLLAVLTAMGCLVLPAAAAEDSVASTGTSLAELKELLNAISYEEYLKKNADVPVATKSVTVNAADYLASETNAKVEVVNDYEGADGKALFFPDTGTVSWKVNVPETAKYGVSVKYYPVVEYTAKDGTVHEGKSASIERMFLVNGKVLFDEARIISMTKVWSNTYFEDTAGQTKYVYGTSEGDPQFRQDINGNDIRPAAYMNPEWREYVFEDSSGYYAGGLQFCLEKGENIISLRAVREPVVIESISLFPLDEAVTMEQYVQAHGGSESSVGAESVYIDAEKPFKFSDDAIYPINDRTSALTYPQKHDAQPLNTIGGKETYKTAGQWVSYEFQVEKTGWYTIASRYKQDDLPGMFTSRIIKINGEVPYEEAYAARFDYSKSWEVENINDGEKDLKFWFEAGKTYELTVEVGLGSMDDTLRKVEEVLGVINNGYLEVIKLTGADPDKYRDYQFSRVMPQVLVNFVKQSRILTEVSEELVLLCGTKGSHVATLDKIAHLLNQMGTDESSIAGSLKSFKTYIGSLGTWLNDSRSQPVQFDYFLIVPEEGKLPKANESFFEAIWYEIKLFVASFFVDYSNMGATTESSEDAVEVWLTAGRDQSLVIRNMVDSMFSPKTDIAVDVKLVAAGTLLPSVLSNMGPDSFIGIGAADVINYAIRSAVLPLDGFEGFEEIMTEFTDAARVPLTLYDYDSATNTTTETVYGLPETMSFSMLFYRTDILADLGIEIPRTWDDVLAAVTVLQANNMQIGLQRDYDVWLYQMGGERYADHGMRTGIDSNTALEAFEYYCRFYTMYSFPPTYDASNRFRTGEMPIVIGGYTAMYNTLTVFATEIQGLWDFTVMPGYVRDDGTFDNSAMAAIGAVVMMNGCENQKNTWEFMKWYVGHEAQSSYCNQLITTIGPAAKHATANRQALADMAWTSGEISVLLDQFDNIAVIENHPGGYIMDRYISFAFLNAYNKGKEPVEQLRSYITAINKEITRKREEFGMETLELGQTLAEREAEASKGDGE
ncbi:MAG: extracellular solute-binding protein [Ruminococcaceae bacterium]|nr:extracellular solute-binding protein [Oscillospiraceae bacterium]